MILFILAFLGGVLTIISPCILPVLPFVFARADRPFVRSGLPLLVGMAATFSAFAAIATVGGAWLVRANDSAANPVTARRDSAVALSMPLLNRLVIREVKDISIEGCDVSCYKDYSVFE
jgi:cytochrome c biogenesis protein CcdA